MKDGLGAKAWRSSVNNLSLAFCKLLHPESLPLAERAPYTERSNHAALVVEYARVSAWRRDRYVVCKPLSAYSLGAAESFVAYFGGNPASLGL